MLCTLTVMLIKPIPNFWGFEQNCVKYWCQYPNHFLSICQCYMVKDSLRGHVGAWVKVSDGQVSDMQDGCSVLEVRRVQARDESSPPNNSMQRLQHSGCLIARCQGARWMRPDLFGFARNSEPVMCGVVWCERHTVTTPQGFEIPLWKKENPYYLLKTICRDIGIWTIANMELRTKYVLKQNRQRCEENTVKKHRFLFMPAKHIKLGLTGNPTNPALLPLSCGEGFWSSRAIKCWWLLVGRVGFCCSGFPTKTRAVCWDKALHA